MKVNLVSRFVTYIRERFPVFIALSYSLLVGLVAFYALGIYSPKIIFQHSAFWLISITYFLFLLRARLFDEVKDYEYDLKNYPNRPISRGLLSTKEVTYIAYSVLIIEIIVQVLLAKNTTTITAYVLFLGFSLLMTRDFYIKKFLDTYFLPMVILHHIVFIFLTVYMVSAIHLTLSGISSTKWAAIVALFFIPPLLYELGRKLRPRIDSDGKITKDTYAARWGQYRVFWFMYGLIIILLMASHSIFPHSIISLSLLIAFLAVSLITIFSRHKTVLFNKGELWSVALCFLLYITIIIEYSLQ